MGLQLENLNDDVRKMMLEELERDIADGTLYYGPRLTEYGRGHWESWLRESLRTGTPESLAEALRQSEALTSDETRVSKLGRQYRTPTRLTAAQTLAYGEFNRFYIRGVCRVAMGRDLKDVEVCRAMEVENPRSESEDKIGMRCPASALLEDLRKNKEKTEMGIPSGPNSGLSVRLPG